MGEIDAIAKAVLEADANSLHRVLWVSLIFGGGRVPVDHDRRLLFIHIPKTGGTTILTLLGLWQHHRAANLETLFGEFGGLDLQHLTLVQAQQFLTPAEYGRLHSFAFVRNPWDRTVSAALWRRHFPDEGVRDLHDYVGWAERVNRVGPQRPSDAHALPQTAFLTGRGGRPVDRIGRFEHFADDVRAILGPFVELPRQLPHKLRHDRAGHYRDHYTAGLQARVAALYGEDAARFGYRF